MVLPVAAVAGSIIIAGLRISKLAIQKYGRDKAIKMALEAAKKAKSKTKPKAKPKAKPKQRDGKALKTEASQGTDKPISPKRTDLLQRRNKPVSDKRPNILDLKRRSYTLSKTSDAAKMVRAKKPATTSKITKVGRNKANASKTTTYVKKPSTVVKAAKYTGATLMGGIATHAANQWINQTPQNRKKKKK